MNSIWYSLLNRSRQTFLQRLWYLRVASSMRDLSCVFVAIGVVSRIGNLILYALRDLSCDGQQKCK
jgi:hypothetical protein